MTLALPLSDAQWPLKRSEEAAPSPADDDVLAGKRVVIAEDEGIISLQMDRILTRAGMRVVGKANNGSETVEIVLRERPDIILMDIRMPLMDGMQAAERILAEYRPCIVFVTAFGDYQGQAKQIDACGYLVKPVTAQKLVPFLQEAYALWQQRS
ncbi:MAG TPA: response regulator [Chthonomonadaceae bacterium]|nr:response regulator [Chthonomonadaceae bacterium]